MHILAAGLSGFAAPGFWIQVIVLAGIYGIFTLGLQLNVGYTGIYNFGQVGFMAIGAYAAAILVLKSGLPLWASLIIAFVIAMLAGVLLGLPSLRLRADYLAIATIAFGEIVRLVAKNLRGLTGGNQGLLGYDNDWATASNWISDRLSAIGLGNYDLLPLLIVTVLAFVALAAGLRVLQNSPWGRVLRAVREDEDAARALGKNAFYYKLQSLALSAGLAAIAGFLLSFNLAFLNPREFLSLYTFIGYTILILGGLASYGGVAIGGVIIYIILNGTRFLDLPLADEQIAAIRFMIIGVLLILLMVFRPQGILGKRQEMVLGASNK
jgi:branched-chain amino acid transport system permease protein